MRVGEMDDGVITLLSTCSLNNRLVLEKYVKGEIRKKITNGFALIDQKVTLKGLKVLMNAYLNGNVLVKKGSIAYIKEEILHAQPWAQKSFEAEGIEGQFLIADLTYVEFIVPPQGE